MQAPKLMFVAASTSLILAQTGFLPLPACSEISTPEPSATTNSSTTSTPDLKTLLHSLKIATSRTQRALLNIINDVGQTPMAVDPGDPRFFEPSEHQIEKDPVLWEKEFTKFGAFSQPHKKWVDEDMAHLKQCLDTLNSEASSVSIPESQQSAASSAWAQMSTELKDLNAHYGELQNLTQGPKYDNLAIAKAALAIRGDLVDFDKHLKNLIKANPL